VIPVSCLPRLTQSTLPSSLLRQARSCRQRLIRRSMRKVKTATDGPDATARSAVWKMPTRRCEHLTDRRVFRASLQFSVLEKLSLAVQTEKVVNQELAALKATSVGMDNWTSVPKIGLLKILTSPPILVARSRMPARPQCPSRPFSST
jgi:hypothetical protein